MPLPNLLYGFLTRHEKERSSAVNNTRQTDDRLTHTQPHTKTMHTTNESVLPKIRDESWLSTVAGHRCSQSETIAQPCSRQHSREMRWRGPTAATVELISDIRDLQLDLLRLLNWRGYLDIIQKERVTVKHAADVLPRSSPANEGWDTSRPGRGWWNVSY